MKIPRIVSKTPLRQVSVPSSPAGAIDVTWMKGIKQISYHSMRMIHPAGNRLSHRKTCRSIDWTLTHWRRS